MILLLPAISDGTYAQISPGALSRAHAGLEGISNCTKCHEIGKQVSAAKCLSCHKEIANLINQSRGYHSSAEVKSKNCWQCHNEHHGKDFMLVRFDKKNFDHRKTTFEQTGKHAQIGCNECHQSKNISDQNLKKRQSTFLGLTHACTGCHEDVHKKTLGDNCSNCHTTTAFKPAVKFDHAKAKFKLVGKHTTVDCASCHKKETQSDGKIFQKFKGLNFANCSPCHDDFHKGKLGQDCKKCHNPSGFHLVNTQQFDHNRTNFKLTGRHEFVKCETCHNKERGTKPKSEKCTDCHADYHTGQFVDAAKKVIDCALCHTVKGFSPSTFTIERHAAAGFALEGAHLSTPCFQCHKTTGKWIFKNTAHTCSSCHENVHGQELTPAFLGDNACDKCHSVQSWQKINFDHNKTAFELQGKHAAIMCRQCHMRLDDATKRRDYKFKSVSDVCLVCHTDIHNGQFSSEQKNYCLNCHNTENWQPVKFNHEETRFPLLGAHAKVQCQACHKEEQKNGVSTVIFKLGDVRCAACHS